MRALDVPLGELAPEPAAAALAREPELERAQAVRCGARWIALPYGWARAAVDHVELSAVPGAPAWLAGAANVEGQILPVLDLAAWLAPGSFVDASAKDARLLVGGHGDDSVALLFQGMPRLVRVAKQAKSPALPVAADRLTPFLLGTAVDDAATLAIDAPVLVESLIAELALL